MRISIMQPYFMPYAGYFRLISSTDLFIIYDCVQFIRNGWIHRNKLPNLIGKIEWLTLPIKKIPRNSKINEIRLVENAKDIFRTRLEKFLITNTNDEFQKDIIDKLLTNELHLSIYLQDLIKIVCNLFGFHTNFITSSSLNIPIEYKGQDRIIEICKRVGATSYLNSPGGMSLYSENCFTKNKIKLEFLKPYIGNQYSILYRLLNEQIVDIKNEITNQ